LQKLWLSEAHENRTGDTDAKQFWESWRAAPDFAAKYAATADGIALAGRLVKDLGNFGSVVRFQTYGGHLHVIFKGYPGLRRVLTGTKYLATNPKVIQMGVGRSGAFSAIRGGAVLTVVLVTAFRVFDYLMMDDQTLSFLLGTLATDFIKIGTSAAAAVAAVGLITSATATVIAVGPLVVAIIVGVGVGFVLDVIDERFGLTRAFVAELERTGRRITRHFQEVQDQVAQVAGDAAEAITMALLDEVEKCVRSWLPNVIFGRY